MIVSSNQLILASPAFRAMLSHECQDVKSLWTQDGKLEMDLRADDAFAFGILMAIIHGQTSSVPRIISFEQLFSFALLVDKYGLHEATEPFADFWTTLLSHLDVTRATSARYIGWIVIAWIFKKTHLFNRVTLGLIKLFPTAIHEGLFLGLPVPANLIGGCFLISPIRILTIKLSLILD